MSSGNEGIGARREERESLGGVRGPRGSPGQPVHTEGSRKAWGRCLQEDGINQTKYLYNYVDKEIHTVERQLEGESRKEFSVLVS